MAVEPQQPRLGFEDRVSGIAALAEPLRRALYRYVLAQRRPVSRDEAAGGAGVPRHVASFHLDRLEAEGLLESEFRRPPGKSGPGAGRPAKLYRRSSGEVSVSLPERRYGLAGRILAEAITRAERDSCPLRTAMNDAAVATGRTLGEQSRAAVAPGAPTGIEALHRILEEQGYEPYVAGTEVFLANCPFHALAQDYTELVCGMNLGVLQGLVDGIGLDDVEARLDPAPGRCCVALHAPGA